MPQENSPVSWSLCNFGREDISICWVCVWGLICLSVDVFVLGDEGRVVRSRWSQEDLQGELSVGKGSRSGKNGGESRGLHFGDREDVAIDDTVAKCLILTRNHRGEVRKRVYMGYEEEGGEQQRGRV